MPHLFFRASRNAWRQMTDLFDVTWPSVAGLWNLRWQVIGYKNAVPGAKQNELLNRFIYGSKIHGVNISRAFFEHTWDKQQEYFAKVLLVNACAIYEGWLDEINEVFSNSIDTTSMQFPYPSKKQHGIKQELALATSSESLAMKSAFYSPYSKGKHINIGCLENMLICYRYFKECRNCYMHNGNEANPNLINTQNQYLTLTNPLDIGLEEIPEFIQLNKPGEQVVISLRGVVGFCGLVQKIIATCDSELLRSKHAEAEFVIQWKEIFGSHRRTLGSTQIKKHNQLLSYTRKMGLKHLDKSEELILFAVKERLVSL